MSIFWTPDEDEDDRPAAGSWRSRTVTDEVTRWIDQRAVQKAGAAFGAFVHRLSARTLTARRLLRPAIRHRRVSS